MVERSEVRSAKAANKSLSATDAAGALDLESDQVESVDFGTSDEDGFGAFSESAANFPVEADNYLTLSSGFADVAFDPDNSTSTSGQLGGLGGPGNATDMVQMELELNVPEGATQVSFDFKFLSEEFPEYVGSQFNDGFVVEMGSSTFTVDGSNLKAEDNLAFDENGNPITVNTAFDLSEGEATGTTYDGATPTLTTTVPLPTGKDKVTLIFSIFDVSDRIYDSTVFLDDLQFGVSDLELAGLEVNQSIQNLGNDIPLIEDKPTRVRAFVQGELLGPIPFIPPTNLRLRAFRDGKFIGSTGAQNSFIWSPPTNEIDPENDPEAFAERRADLSNSLNFELPTDWLSGDVTLQLSQPGGGLGNPQGVDCSPAPGIGTDCEKEVSFQSVPNLRIRIVRVSYEDNNGNIQSPNTSSETIVSALRSMYPVAGVTDIGDGEPLETTIENQDIAQGNTAPSAQTVQGELSSMYTSGNDGSASPNAKYIGIVRDVSNSGLAGQSNGIPANEAFFVDGVSEATIPHEIGHTLGLQHPNDPMINAAEGPCRAPTGTSTSFPYIGRDLQSLGLQGASTPSFPGISGGPWQGFATLGTAPNVSESVWGYDVSDQDILGSSDVAQGGPNGELMSYCHLDDGGDRWVSEFSYSELRESIENEFGSSSPAVASTGTPASLGGQNISSTQAQDEYLVVVGSVDLSGSDAEFRSFSTARLNPSQVQDLSDASESGAFTLRVLDESGSAVEEISFELNVSPEIGGSNRALFKIPVLKSSDINEVQVLSEDGSVLASKTASPNPPEVTVESPNGGESLSGEQTTVEWSASDPDGNDLTFDVQYSRDGGTSWKPLEVNTSKTALEVDLSSLGGTDEGLVRVKASDGFNTAQDESDGTFSVANTGPNGRIFSPSDGAQIDTSATVVLRGDGADLEDGQLSGPDLQWRSSKDGPLGSGRTLNVPASELSVGEHTITLEGTDSEGATDEASVTIEIVEAGSTTEESDEEDLGEATGQVFYPLEGQGSLQVGRTLENVQVEVRSEGSLIGTATTGEDGSFQLELPAGGPYEARVDPESVGQSLGAAGQNVDVFDLVRAVQALYGFDPLVGPFHEQVADVDGTGGLQSPDLFQIIRFTNGTIGGFEAGPWAVGTEENVQVEANGAVTGLGLEVAERGDVDLSGGAASKDGSKEGQPKSGPAALATTRSGTASLQPGETAEIPVRLEGGASVGAYALALDVPAEKIELQGVEAPAGKPRASLKEGTLTVGWAAVEAPPLEVGDGEALAVLKVAVPEGTEGGLELEVSRAAAVGPEGAPLEGATLAVPGLEAGPERPEEFALKGSRPNPASGPARIVVDLPERTAVTVEVYNTLGQRVLEVRETMAGGRGQALQLDGSGLSSGQYFYRVRAELGEETVRETGRLTVVR